jgi:peptide/nickel transport system substrate-binding protein
MHGRSIRNPKVLILTPLVLVLLFAMACGSSAPAAPVVVEKEVIKEVIKEVPVEKVVIKEVIKEVVVQSEVMAKSSKGGAGKAPATIVPGVAVAMDVMAPAKAITAGKHGGHINMDDYADVRQRIMAQSSVLNKQLSPMFNTLMEFNPETPDFNDLRCDMCTSWELAADGVTYTFHINPAAKWWDGVPVTADDVVFSLEAQINPDQFPILEGRSTSATVNTGLYIETGTTRAIDDKTVEITTIFPAGAFLTALSNETAAIQAKHVVLDQGIEQGGKDLWAIVGSGPFKFVDYEKEVSVEYVKNEDYWKEGLPYIDSMTHFIITDSGRAIAAYKTEQVLTSNQNGYTLSNDEALRLGEEMDNLTVHWGPAEFARYIMMNTTVAPFDQAEVRMAVHLAMDRQAILDATSAGQGVQGFPLPPNAWYSNTDEEYANMPGYRYVNGKKDPADIAEAQALLKSVGADGPFKLTMSSRVCCGYPDVAVILKQQLQNAFGWDITLETLESGAGFDKYWAGDFTFAVQGGNIWSSDPDAVGSRYTRGTTMQWVGGGRGKRFVPPGIDEVYEAQQREKDQDKRRALVQQMGEIILAGTANPYINWSRKYWAVNHKIQNFNFTSEGRAWEHVWCDPTC